MFESPSPPELRHIRRTSALSFWLGTLVWTLVLTMLGLSLAASTLPPSAKAMGALSVFCLAVLLGIQAGKLAALAAAPRTLAKADASP